MIMDFQDIDDSKLNGLDRILRFAISIVLRQALQACCLCAAMGVSIHRWAMERMGKCNGALRLPLLELEAPHHKPIEEALQAAGCI